MKMTATLSRIFATPMEQKVMSKQGIEAILNSDGGGRSEGSIRRTLSADMSSKKWLEQNGMMKKVVSSQELMKLPVSLSDSSSDEEDENEEEKQKPAELEYVWNSIMTSKKENDLPMATYVHPLLKRSSSALSDKSLKICTESLGSETGSDCFSVDEGKDEDMSDLEEELKEVEDQCWDFFPKYRKSPATLSPSPLPPPIQSISGASIHMNSRRENGKLVVEAVSVPPREFFQAQRCDGRLVLSLIRTPPTDEESDEATEIEETTDEEIFEGGDSDTGGDDCYEEEEETPKKSGVMIRKFGIEYQTPKANKTTTTTATDVAEVEEVKKFTVAQSLPPPPPLRVQRLIPRPPTPATTSASYNSYDYSWRNMKAISVGGFINKRRHHDVKSEGLKGNENKAEHFGPHLWGCKEGRRSLLIWEPYCIAT